MTVKPPTVRLLLWGVIVGSVLFSLVLGWLQFEKHHSLVFYGDDTYGHLLIAASIRDSNVAINAENPYLVQKVAVGLSNLFHTGLIETYTSVAIASLPLAVLFVSLLAVVAFSLPVGALTAFFFGFVSIQPVQTYLDGTIPNIYGSGVLIPLAIISLVMACKSTKLRIAWIGVGLAAGYILSLTHHFSTLVAGMTTLTTLALFSVWLAIKPGKKPKIFALILLMLIVVSIAALIGFEPRTAAQALARSYVHLEWHWPFFIFTNSAAYPPWTTQAYGTELSGTVFQVGIVGGVLLLYQALTAKKISTAIPFLALASWGAIYWIGSLTRFSGEPNRLARDFSLPGSILAAYALYTALSFVWKHKPRAIVPAVLVSLALCLPTIQHRYGLLTSYQPTKYGAASAQALAEARTHSGKVGIFSQNFYLWAVARALPLSVSPLYSASETAAFAQASQTACIIQPRYSVIIAGNNPDPQFNQPVVTQPPFTVEQFNDDQATVWLSCKPAQVAE